MSSTTTTADDDDGHGVEVTPTPRPKLPELQFWDELDLRRIRKIWQGAGASELEHTRDHLRFAMPGGMPVTVTQAGITMPTLDRAAIRASVETADLLWGGAHVSGDREGQLWAKAYGLATNKTVTTKAKFTQDELRRIGEMVDIFRAEMVEPRRPGDRQHPDLMQSAAARELADTIARSRANSATWRASLTPDP